MLSPILEKLTDESNPPTLTGSGLPIDLVTINTDEQSELAQMYNVGAVCSFRLERRITVCILDTIIAYSASV